MTDLETLITLLASQVGENPNLRQALTESVLAALSETTPAQPPETVHRNYRDLLAQISQNRRLAEQERKPKTAAALQHLEDQLQFELEQAAIALHYAVSTRKKAVNQEHLRRVGVNITQFPTGFPTPVNLLALSKAYLMTVTDLYRLESHTTDALPELTRKLAAQVTETAGPLQDVAWEALSTGLFTDRNLFAFHQTCLAMFQSRRQDAEQALLKILKASESAVSPESARQFDAWLHTFGSPFRTLLNDLLPKYPQRLPELLIRSEQYSGLEALVTIEPSPELHTLMTIRFGQPFLNAAKDWKGWLRNALETATSHVQAVDFWKAHPYVIPTVLMLHESVGELEIPEPLYAKLVETSEYMPLVELLNRQRRSMTAVEKRILEQQIQIEAESVRPPQAEKPVPPLLPEKEIEIEAEPSPLVKGAVETALDFALTGNLVDAAVFTTIERGAEIADAQLSVTIEDEEAEQQIAPQPEPQIFFKTEPQPVVEEAQPTTPKRAPTRRPPVKQKPPKIKVEPEKSLWRDHIFPFVSQNLVFVLAASMIFTGLLVLEFYLWDKAAWVRYALTPLLIVVIAYALSRFGLWLKGEDIPSETPIMILQSVSVFLAPMSLLFVALLFGDASLTLLIKLLWGLALAAALLLAWSYIFGLAIQTVYRPMAWLHVSTLLLLNALLLLLPVTQFTMLPGDLLLNATAKGILVIGFYAGFVVLSWSMHRVLGMMLDKGTSAIRIPMTFYSVTCLGTFLLVWGLTHARRLLLPQPYTYGPLLILFSFLMLLVEFKLLARRPTPDPSQERNSIPSWEGSGVGTRITALSYTAYFFIGLGVLLSIPHDYVRVLALLLAGFVWFYQAFRLRSERHFTIALGIFMIGFSMIALIRDFPSVFFPYLTLLVAFGVYQISLTFPDKEVATVAASLSPIYLSLAFVIAILWQWADKYPPLSYGVAFALFGMFALYVGAKTDKLIHVHAGAGYIVAALPYLGFANMEEFSLAGNTLVFGLALVGMVWLSFSSLSGNHAIKASRSTVLWNIGILAFSIMVLRLIAQDTLDMAASPLAQFQTLSGPVLIGALMLAAGYVTNSYTAVYVGLVILVIIFPEIKDRFNIPMYSGIGSTASGIGFLLLVFVLSLWKALRQPRTPDLIWRKNAFPFQAQNPYLLFANPLVVAAFFLFTRTIFWTYPQNYFRPLQPFSVKTTVAVLLCGTAYHVFSVWFRQSWFSYIGFIAIFFGILHSCYVDAGVYTDPLFLPIFILAAFLYCEGLRFVIAKILPEERATVIAQPFRHLQFLAIWGGAFGLYVFYSVYYATLYQTTFFYYWIPLILYLGGISFWLAWHVKQPGQSWWFLIPAYLFVWQGVVLLLTRGEALPYVLEPTSRFYLSTALTVLGMASTFFLWEWFVSKEKFMALSPLLWLSLVLLLEFSLHSVLAFYTEPEQYPFLSAQIALWAVASFVLGRYLNFGPLWLWSIFLAHLLILPAIGVSTHFYLSRHPFTLACLALVLAILSGLARRFKNVFVHRYAWSWAHTQVFAPPFLFAGVSQLLVLCAFIQAAFSPSYRHAWITILGLFLAAVPAILAAHQLNSSRRFLFGLPYTAAWVALLFALRFNLTDNSWLSWLSPSHLICCGLFGALLTMVLGDAVGRLFRVAPHSNRAYAFLKYGIAAGILIVLSITYLEIRNLERLDWQWLALSGVLSLGIGAYFRYLAEPRSE